MRGRISRIGKITGFLVFVLLETAALMLVSNYDAIKNRQITQILSRPVNSLSKGLLSIGDYFSLRKDNNRLFQENVALRNENEMLWEIIGRRAEKMNNSFFIDSDEHLFTYIPAKIVSNSTDRLKNYIIIDKGIKDSVDVGMGIITEKGIIGYIVSTGERYSKVSSILNIDNMFSAELEKTGTFGTVKWEGASASSVTMREIPVHTVFAEGDTVVSSGYSLIYPAQIPIGTVSNKDLRDGTNYSATIRLFENFNRIKYVYVVKRNDMRELEMLNTDSEEDKP